MTPHIRTMMDELVQKATEKRIKGSQVAGWVFFSIVVLFLVLSIFGGVNLLVLLILLVAVALVVWRMKARRRDSSDLPWLREAMPVVLSGPWQTWPCRL